MVPRYSTTLIVYAVLTVAVTSAQSGAPAQQPSRDTPAQQQATPPPSGAISGRVLTADTGRPVKRARVFVTSPALQEGRAAMTDDSGAFELTGLPAGRYSVTAAKTGFITLSYGQRRPLQPGTPLQLDDHQQIKGLDFRLPRGGVISGHVFDEDGEPMPGAFVRVLRYEYLQGDRRLVPAGGGQTDDRGAYRVWGLNPGEYYVNVTVRTFGGGRFAFGFGRGGFGPGGGPAAAGPDDEELGYAPTYFPGVSSPGDARAIPLDVSQEVDNIDFGIQLVHTARISGVVDNPDGTATSSGNIMLMPDNGAAAVRGRGQIGMMYGARIQWDGTFVVVNVPPGRYTLRARGNDTDPPQWAEQPISINGVDVSGVTVILQPGATVSGSVAFQATGAQSSADPTQVRIVAASVGQDAIGPIASARADKDGRFTLDGVPAGMHLLRANGVPRGWMLKSVMAGGQEIVDSPIELRAGQKLSGVTFVFTDRLTQVSGTVATTTGTPVTDVTVLAFPTDTSLWRPQSRQIMTARPDQNGMFQLRGLPPGEYYLVPIDPSEPGEWFEPAFLQQHQTDAVRFTLGEGETRTQDLRVSGQ
ncbi:MAG: carboxypeptidase regulatory-like domain-containing protein [Betaproteobacteria bacterium]